MELDTLINMLLLQTVTTSKDSVQMRLRMRGKCTTSL